MYAKLAIKNWVNSRDFNVMLNEITTQCIEHVDAYCSLRDKAWNVSWISLSPEMVIDTYFMTTRFPLDLRKYMKAEIIKKYGALLDKKMKERLRTNNLHNDF